jgi:7,8-dihydropterin-6-yl-methyl-4-(beta-D-ribofuranosyl)aminobenzene 5'-phosphate synthase
MISVRITILVDNYVQRRGLLAEHGWACWVETPTCRLLFDTGQGQALLPNARELGIPLELTNAIVLSHGHYDHTGALGAMLDLAPAARVFAHPAALGAKCKRAGDGHVRAIGLSVPSAELRTRLAARLVATRSPTQISSAVWVTGEVPRVTDFEPGDDSFCLDAAGEQPDALSDDQALIVRAAAGIVVLLGCAHAGVINTLRYALTLHPGLPLVAVLGGMHLHSVPTQRVTRTLGELAVLGVSRVIPAHCTGLPVLAALATGLPRRCTPSEVGAVFEFTTGTEQPRGQ